MRKYPRPLETGERDDLLEDYGMYCDEHGYTRIEVYGWYRRYTESRYIALPFPGAWVDQPRWLRHDFNICNLMDAYIADNTPSVQDMGGTQSIASDKW